MTKTNLVRTINGTRIIRSSSTISSFSIVMRHIVRQFIRCSVISCSMASVSRCSGNRGTSWNRRWRSGAGGAGLGTTSHDVGGVAALEPLAPDRRLCSSTNYPFGELLADVLQELVTALVMTDEWPNCRVTWRRSSTLHGRARRACPHQVMPFWTPFSLDAEKETNSFAFNSM